MQWPIRKGEMVMPALLWVTFWSLMMGSVACLGEPRPIPVKAKKPRD
jgi:hypothetical protein